jgi:hypothetical protein
MAPDALDEAIARFKKQVMGCLEDLRRFRHDETGANRTLATDQPATPRPNVE